MSSSNEYSHYFHAEVVIEKIWLIVSLVKTFDNVMYHRTYEDKERTMEFLVPDGTLEDFLVLMDFCKKAGYISSVEEVENRFK